jgi:DNA-nicking Smr family endonuclease
MADAVRTRRRRELTVEERVLWEKVAESVRPLGPRKLKKVAPVPEMPAVAAEPAPPAKKRGAGKPPSPLPAKSLPPKPAPRPLAAMEPKLARTLRRGGEVDARLDLHGLRQDEAHARLRAFVRRAQGEGARVVLVITGKGRPDQEVSMYEQRGVLRRLVPAWLAEPDLRHAVLGFSEASVAHGGAGALYVRIRRER